MEKENLIKIFQNDDATPGKKGYSGNSMSLNAIRAYENGEKPASKWTKSDIIAEIAKIDRVKAEKLKKASAQVLRDRFLVYSSWHHSSSRFNVTRFYSIDEDAITDMTIAEAEKIAAEKTTNVKSESTTFIGDLHYVEWVKARKRYKPVYHKLENVTIEQRGCFYVVTDKSGAVILRKKINSNGTTVYKAKTI